MNDRRMELLNILLNSNVWLSGKECAEILKVSDRTIRSDIKIINTGLKEFGIEIRSNRNRGYGLTEEDKLIYIQKVQLSDLGRDTSPIPKSPFEREQYLLYRLIEEEKYITMEILANELYVSKTTIYLDVRRILETREFTKNIHLDISNIDGLKLVGDEISKRRLLSSTFKMDDEFELNFNKSLYYANRWDPQWGEMELLYLYELLISTLTGYECSMVDKDIILFTKEILVTVMRVKNNNFAERMMNEYLVMNVVKDIVDKLNNHYEISLCENEIHYIQSCFNSKRLLSIGEQKTDTHNEAVIIVEKFIEKVNCDYNIDLIKSDNFMKNMLLHMGPTLSRLKTNVVEKSEIIEQIQKKYPFAYEISTRITPIIKQETGFTINETELTYISLHVAVALNNIFKKKDILIVCGSGYTTAKLIKNEIMSRYNTFINKINHVSFSSYESMNGSSSDLIISTVPLERKKNSKPILLVNPILNNQDIANLDLMIKKECLVNDKEKQEVMNFFPKRLFELNKSLESYFETIRTMTEKLKSEKYINSSEGFYKSVCKREELYSTILDNGIAIPHPMESMSNTTVVSVSLLKKPIRHDGKDVTAILLFAINSNEAEELNRLYELLEVIIESSSLSKQFRHLDSYEEFVNAIVREDVRA